MELNCRILTSFKCFFYCLHKWLIKLTSDCFFAIQSVLAINIKSQIKKLLVLINQPRFWFTLLFIYIAIRNKIQDCTFADINFSDFSIFIFKVNQNFQSKFPDEINRYCLDLIPVKRYRSCCTKENLRCINSSVI